MLIPRAPLAISRVSLASRSTLRAAPRPTLMAAQGRTASYSSFEGPKVKKVVTEDTTRRNGMIAAVLIATAAGLWYWETSRMGVYPSTARRDEFTVVVGRKVNRQTLTFDRKTNTEIEEMLHEHEASEVPTRLGNPVARWDTNFIASNEPSEDRSAADIVPRGKEGETGQRDLAFFSVIDGHAGDATSQLLSRTLHPTLSLGLAGLQAGIVPGRSWYGQIYDILTWAKTWSPINISKSLEASFVKLDDHISAGPIRALPDMLTDQSDEAREKFAALAAPAAAGAVVGTALVDAENDSVYVAVTGDCRAVAGWQGPDGWRSDTLSEDQMGDNPKEVARMRAEHPPYEGDTVIRNGRVQGGLQPTRAFGDAVYKWTTVQGEAVNALIKDAGEKPRSIRPWNFTPPYVTARPVVEYRRLKGANGEKLRFIVLATDGLWDRITSEEATLLTAAYLAEKKRADVNKAKLVQEIPFKTTEPRPFPVQDLPGSGKRGQGQWVFEGDANAATHLIRNALGGGDRKLRGELLSLNGKVARYFRDDMTVTVIFFEE
ncbi:hypothetical protein CspHIS471_0305830 [Cutaneotrichosporon sp. HIS471]|nr:hypothetical protein CspHIS471_0305830 [Cutaneotrichosporon sp. HIS471]